METKEVCRFQSLSQRNVERNYQCVSHIYYYDENTYFAFEKMCEIYILWWNWSPPHLMHAVIWWKPQYFLGKSYSLLLLLPHRASCWNLTNYKVSKTNFLLPKTLSNSKFTGVRYGDLGSKRIGEQVRSHLYIV